jgi:hypothetical protein
MMLQLPFRNTPPPLPTHAASGKLGTEMGV